MKHSLLPLGFVLLPLALLPVACSDDDGRPSSGETGSTCEAASECYPDLEEGALSGDALCLENVPDGYCTHSCEADDDCCAADGECPVDREQVCSPLESGDGKMCLLSCEDADLESDPDAEDANDYCERNAGSAFSCRSSGGGSENRKVCMPSGDTSGGGTGSQ